MRNLIHLWFDVDDTLYGPPPALEKLRMTTMYGVIADAYDCPFQEVQELYDASYAKDRSHRKAFRDLGLDPKMSREKYGRINTPRFLKRDEKLIALFNNIDKRRVPCSLYSNNSFRMTARILFALGLVARKRGYAEPLPHPVLWKTGEDEKDEGFNLSRFAYILPSDRFPKGEGPEGFRQILINSKEYHERQRDLGRTTMRFSPDCVVYVGDREKVDIRPAAAQGMKTVLVSAKLPSTTHATFVIPTIYGLEEIIERLDSVPGSKSSS